MKPRRDRPWKRRRLTAAQYLARGCAIVALAALVAAPPVQEPRAGGVPSVGNPECVRWCDGGSSGGGSEGENEGGRGSLFNLFDRMIERAEEAKAKRRQDAYQQNEQGVREYNRGNYAEALRLFREATENNPDDPVIRQNVKNAEAEVARLERQKQRQEEERLEQAQFRRRMAQMAGLMPAPKLSGDPDRANLQIRPVINGPGFSEAGWQAYLNARDEAARLYVKLNQDGVLSDADTKAFYAALQLRNNLWEQAQAQRLDGREREQIRLPIAVVDSKIRQIVTDSVQKLTGGAPPPVSPDRRADPSSGVDALVADHSAAKGTRLVEDAAGDAVGAAHGRRAGDRFENLLGVGRVAVRAREEGRSGATAETVDLIISKLPKPMGARAEGAVEGGRQYSNVAYRALNRFMEDAAKATGHTFDAEAFWRQLDEDLTEKQKAVKKWITFGK